MKRSESEKGFKLLLIDSKGMVKRSREILKEKKVTIPLLIDSRFYSRNVLTTMYTPTTIVIDREGRLRARLVGGSKDFKQVLMNIVGSL
ncbi:MAG: hypothetical protein KAV42_03795 [Candidatus Krumholzibacteria bacterium]|nr:hypothetical protein [Candidatus Krumholzibacteria bacterium]